MLCTSRNAVLEKALLKKTLRVASSCGKRNAVGASRTQLQSLLAIVDGAASGGAAGPVLLSALVLALNRFDGAVSPAMCVFDRLLAAKPTDPASHRLWQSQVEKAFTALLLRQARHGSAAAVDVLYAKLRTALPSAHYSDATTTALCSALYTMHRYDAVRALVATRRQAKGYIEPSVLHSAAKSFPYREACTLFSLKKGNHASHALLSLLQSASREASGYALCVALIQQARDIGVECLPQHWDQVVAAQLAGGGEGVVDKVAAARKASGVVVTPSLYILYMKYSSTASIAEARYEEAITHRCANDAVREALMAAYHRLHAPQRAALFLEHVRRERQDLTPTLLHHFRATTYGDLPMEGERDFFL